MTKLAQEKLTKEEIEDIRKDSDKVDWHYISWGKKLSEGFIREYSDKVNWYYISKYQQLSEDFIREFSNEVYWFSVSCFQKLSKKFIYEFYDKVDWKILCEKSYNIKDVPEWKALYGKKKYNFKDAPKYVKLHIAVNYRDLLECFK